MIDLEVCIMHDRRRAARLPALKDAIRDGYDGPISIADGTNGGPWQALKFANLYATESNRSHLLAVEDDAMLCREFVAGALHLIAKRPDEVIHLFAGSNQAGQEIHEANKRRRSWCRPRVEAVIGNVAVVIPCAIGREFLKWASDPFVDLFIAQDVPHKPLTGDTRLWRFLRDEMNTTSIISIPSLADHADEKSLVGTNQTGVRSAHWFIGRDMSPLEMEWDDGSYLGDGRTEIDPSAMNGSQNEHAMS